MRLLKSGAGLTAIHWSTGADVQYGPAVSGFARRLVQPRSLRPEHREVAADQGRLQTIRSYRGWKEWEIHDEFYLDLQFHEKTQPLLTVKVDGKEQVVGWTIERPDSNGGRSFGTTLGHFHDNFARDDFRRMLINGILWTAHVEIPKEGAPIDVDEKYIKLPPKPE